MIRSQSKMENLKAWQQKYFPERQIFLRSDGRVRFVTITSKMQMILLSILIGLAIWGLIGSYSFFTRDALVRQHHQLVSSMRQDYQSLNNGYQLLEDDLARRASLLEERQRFLEDILSSRSGIRNLPAVELAPLPESESLLKPTAVDAQSKISNTEDPSGQNIPEARPHQTGQNSKSPSGQKISFLGRLLGSNAANASSLDLEERERDLQKAFIVMEAHQRAVALALYDNISLEIADINKVIEGTSLTVKDLAKASQATQSKVQQQAGLGGPFIPDTEFIPVFQHDDIKPFVSLAQSWTHLELARTVLNSLPVSEPAADYYISSNFGRRIDPLKKTAANHPGIDMAGWPGTAIFAAASGTVTHASWYGPYGNMVEIDHGNGFKTRYGHMRKIRVKTGDIVNPGQRVGDMGKTGRVTDTHLHFEVWFNGRVRDPMPFLKAAGDVRKIKGKYEKDAPSTT